MIKPKEKIKKSILICFVCFAISPVLFAYDELIEKKYKTFDGKIFEIKENAISYEKVQKKVNILMKAFKRDIEELEQQTANDIKNHTTAYGFEIPYRNKLKGKKDLYEKYENCLYECIKSLEEKGIDVEIKLIQRYGTLTTHRSSNSK